MLLQVLQVVGKLPLVQRYNIFMSLKTARVANRLFRGSVFATGPPECVFFGTPPKKFCIIFYDGTLARHNKVLTRPTAVHCGTLSASNSHRSGLHVGLILLTFSELESE